MPLTHNYPTKLMTILAKHRVIFSLGAAAFIIIFAIVAIFWARGFKPNFKTRTIERTGLIVATSVPTGAQVYLDNRLTSATDTNIAYLAPKTYNLRIQKDGYTIWQKDIEIKADLATEIKALLFPLAPEIKPLTITGAANPSLSPDYSRIVYGVGGDRGGLYTLEMSNSPFPFRSGPKLIAKNQAGFDFAKAKFIWAPDSKQLIAYFQNDQGTTTSNLLVSTDKSNEELRDVTGSLSATLSSWQQDLANHAQTQALTVPAEIKGATEQAALPSPSPSPDNPATQQLFEPEPQSRRPGNLINYYPTGLVFSPDEEKILYKDKAGKYKVYDLRTKKDWALPNLADLINLSWHPDSNHLVVAQKDLISIIEVDGTNKMTIYSGKFEDGFVFAHPSGDRLIILTTLAQTDGTPPNLYSINLR